MRLLSIFFVMISLSACVTSQRSSDAHHSDDIDYIEYTYDMKLDIKNVISSTDISRDCGVVSVNMKYLDSDGEVKGLSYRALGGGCIDN